MKTAILLFALAGLLFAGTATASAIDQPPQPAEGKVDCAPVIQVACSAYYFICNNYLPRCPVE